MYTLCSNAIKVFQTRKRKAGFRLLREHILVYISILPIKHIHLHTLQLLMQIVFLIREKCSLFLSFFLHILDYYVQKFFSFLIIIQFLIILLSFSYITFT